MTSPTTAAAELLWMLLTDPRLGVLLGLLAVAASIDLARGRIPNWLVLAGLAYALGFNALHPDYLRDGAGLAGSLGGLALGFGLTLPLYLLRGMAAGDVKLMAMTGAFLGPRDALIALLWSFVAGGLMALLLVVARRRVAVFARNVASLFWSLAAASGGGVGLAAPTPRTSAGTLPFGVAIALGTGAYLLAQQYGYV